MIFSRPLRNARGFYCDKYIEFKICILKLEMIFAALPIGEAVFCSAINTEIY